MRRVRCAAALVGLVGAGGTGLLALVVAFAGTPNIRSQVTALFCILLACALLGGVGAVWGALAAPNRGAWCLGIAAVGAVLPALGWMLLVVGEPLPLDTRLYALGAVLPLSIPSALLLTAAGLLRRALPRAQ